MSLRSYGLRKALACAGVGALAALAAAAPANAASLTQTYKCTYPLIGERSLTVDIDAAIPAEWPVNTPTPPFDIAADAEADLGTYQGLDLIGAQAISGQAKATSTVTAPNFTLPVVVPITIPTVTKPAAPPLVFTGLTGQTPSLTFTQPGTVNITVDKLDLNILAKRADGTAIILPPVTPVDSDGDPTTFDVPCVLDPAGQNNTLIDTVVTPGDEPPSPPADLAGTPTTDSVALSWTASTDDNGVTGYDVYQDGVKVDTVTGTSKTITGLTPGTAYKFKVQAVDTADQTSEFSDEITVTTDTPVDDPPSKPTGLAGTPTTDSVALSWTASTDDNGVTGYNVYQDGVKIDTVVGTSKTVTGLTPDTSYAFKVEAIDTADQTTASDEITVKTDAVVVEDTTPPSVPGEPFITSASDVTPTSIHLFWDPSTDDDSGVAGYEIEFIKDSDPAETVEVGNVTDFVLDNLTPGGVYEIRLRAKDNAGNVSEYGDSIVLELPPDVIPGPDAPANLAGSATSETSVDLTWDAVVGDPIPVVAYDVYQDGAKVAQVTTNSATITGLTEGTTYKFKVRAVDALTAVSDFSDEIEVSTPGVDNPPSKPTGLAATAGLKSLDVSWTASTDDKGVDHYDVFVDGTKVDSVTGTSVSLTGLTPATTYAITVQAVDTADQTSELSDELEATTLTDQPPSKPSGLAGTPTATSVALSWTASTDDDTVAGYDVYQDGTKVDTVTGTSKTITGLTPETAYAFKVVAVDNAGQESEASDEVSVTTLSESTGTVAYSYDLSGSSQLKNLTKGSVPLSGGIDADLELATGDYTADLTLDRTRARLRVLGLIPVTADVDFAQTDKTRGSLKGGVLTATAKFKIKLPKVYLFGIVPIVSSDNCQTKSSSIASMKSTGPFDPLSGGSLAGTYGISDLTGCGWLNNLLSPLTKGGGNTINVDLTPAPPAAS